MGSDVVIDRARMVATVGGERFGVVETGTRIRVLGPSGRLVGEVDRGGCVMGRTTADARAVCRLIGAAWWAADDRAAARGGEGR